MGKSWGLEDTHKSCQRPSSLRPGSHSRPVLAQALYLPRRCRRDTPEHRSCLWDRSATELIKFEHSERALLDDGMRVQSHMFPAGIIMDIICTLADPRGIDGWAKAGLGLDAAIDHRLGLSGLVRIEELGLTAMANGVPLEAEPGHAIQLKAVDFNKRS